MTDTGAFLRLLFTNTVEGKEFHTGTTVDLKQCAVGSWWFHGRSTRGGISGFCYNLATISLCYFGKAASPLWALFFPLYLKRGAGYVCPRSHTQQPVVSFLASPSVWIMFNWVMPLVNMHAPTPTTPLCLLSLPKGLILNTCPGLPVSVQKDSKCLIEDYQGARETNIKHIKEKRA